MYDGFGVGDVMDSDDRRAVASAGTDSVAPLDAEARLEMRVGERDSQPVVESISSD